MGHNLARQMHCHEFHHDILFVESKPIYSLNIHVIGISKMAQDSFVSPKFPSEPFQVVAKLETA